ncbi:phage tail protein [Laribacter hongkongensis]|uniref:phage tail protein n=1 Tax=Laribacter hongkongensis TaxID=168471 RepID=UPI001EFC3745|nr:phage tail protein [Laribacter hongkongensis]MCG9095302.1 phage tail protein [Laribacter hongkongensis]
MDKPASLRAALKAALPELARNPDTLQLFVESGQLAATAGASLSWEYRYTLVVLLTWLRQQQPDLLQNRERLQDGLRFDVDILKHGCVDLQVKLKLTERVIVTVDPEQQRRLLSHPPEPVLLPPAASDDWPMVPA